MNFLSHTLGSFLACALAPSVFAATVSLTPIADAFVTAGSVDPSAGNPNANYGGAGALQISGAGTAKGEMQSLLKFSFASAKASFDTTYGVGQWVVESVRLQLGTNFGTQGAQPNNPIFNQINGGRFKLDWLANDQWGEGTGNPGAPFDPQNPPLDGVTFASLSSLTSAADRTVGTLNYVPTGNTSPPGNPAAQYTLTLDSSLLVDFGAGGDISFRAYADEAEVSYLFNARSFGTAGNRPLLIVNAIPEPGTGALLLGALGAILTRRRRRASHV